MKWIKIVRIKEDLITLSCSPYLDKIIKEYFHLKNKFTHFKYVDGDLFFWKEDIEKLKKELFDYKKLKEVITLQKRSANELLEYCSHLKTSKDSLNKKFKKFIKLYNTTVCPLTIMFDFIIKEMLEKELKKYISPKSKKFKKYMESLMIPLYTTTVFREKVEFLKLVIKYKKIPKEILKEHARKFGHLNLRFLMGEPYDIKYYVERIKSLDNPKELLHDMKNHRKKELNEFNKIIKKINYDKKFLDIVNLVRECISFRTTRFEAIIKSAFLARPLFEEIGKKLGLNYNQVIHATQDELSDFLERKIKPDIAEIKRRANGFFLISINNKIKISTDIKKFLGKSSKEGIQEIKGIVAYKGKAVGNVRIIKEPNKIKEFKKSEILVVVMTTPDFVPAIEKAAAIVTDIGGLTSHAAIISRELGKPCIVNTKIATKVLKDGDLVEVDANKGTVRKIR